MNDDVADVNDPIDQPSVSDAISRAGAAVPVPDAAALRRDVQTTFERRRRRRRSVLAGAVGATALATGLTLVAVVGDGGPGDRLVSAPVDTTADDTKSDDTTADTVAPDASDGATGDLDSAPIDRVPDDPSSDDETATESTSVAPVSSDGIRVTGSASQEVVDDVGIDAAAGGVELFAWNDGFLTVRRSSAPQTLPDRLPDELAAAFPQEVLDLFPDGLPDTLAEATAVLQEAGLYGVVSDIVLSDSDVYDAIYSDRPELVTTVRFSTDGVDWADVDADFPVEVDRYPVRQLVSDDRFVLITEPSFDDAGSGRHVDVHVSTDLVEWDRQRIELPDRPDRRGVRYGVQVEAFAANGSGWLATVSVYTDLDVTALLPEGAIPEGDGSNGEWTDVGYDSDGVYVEQFDEKGASAGRQDFTWAEVGLDGPPISDEGQESFGFVSGWDGVPRPVESQGRPRGVARFGDGFVEFGERIRVSLDGSVWTDVALPADGWIGWVLDTGDGLLVSTDTDDGPQRHLLDPDSMTWTPFDLPGLPGQAQLGTNTDGRAIVLVDYDEPPFVQPATIRLTAEADGYALTFVIETSSTGEFGESSYQVVDVATGDVVVSESVEVFDGFGSFSQIGDPSDGGFVVDDPDTGEVLVEFDGSSVVQESLDENGDPIPEPDMGDGVSESVPDNWVVAATSSGLLVEKVETDAGWVTGAAVQGDTVLVAPGDGTFVRLTAR